MVNKWQTNSAAMIEPTHFSVIFSFKQESFLDFIELKNEIIFLICFLGNVFDRRQKSAEVLKEILQGVEFLIVRTNKTDIYGRYTKVKIY